ncbi:MAG TPA: MbcA/ParS/Xre antitoxin family protein [Xanthobacteraceae bacterium]|nr:MbcA/ParS/Xre antitoxin family protein [Xanthobacteraceae bacterium]
MPNTASALDRASVESVALTKATLRAAGKLGLKNRTLATVIGVSEPTVSRMSRGRYFLQPDEKPFELSALFVRLYRSLDAITGGDEKVARSWINNENTALGDTPINLVQKVSGLIHVIQYLDSRRARI